MTRHLQGVQLIKANTRAYTCDNTTTLHYSPNKTPLVSHLHLPISTSISYLSDGTSFRIDLCLLELSWRNTSVIQLVDVGVRFLLGLGYEEPREDRKDNRQSSEEPTSSRSPSRTRGSRLEHVRHGKQENPPKDVIHRKPKRLGFGSKSHRRDLDREREGRSGGGELGCGDGGVEQDCSDDFTGFALGVVETTYEDHDCRVEERSPDDGVSST